MEASLRNCCVFLLCALASFNVASGDFLDKIRSEELFRENNVSIVQVRDEIYLVSVGKSPLSASGTGLSASLTEAKVIAQAKLSEFINGVRLQVSQESRSQMDAQVPDGSKAFVRNYYEELISDSSEGPITGIRTIGTWEADGFCYHALGIKLPRK